jgi:hypothetical protein
MRIRVPVAVRNRLVRLEGRRPVDLPIGGWPPIMNLDEWEVLASRMQDELCRFAQEEIRRAPEREPVAVRPSVKKADDDRQKGGLSPIEEYLLAQRNVRQTLIKNA